MAKKKPKYNKDAAIRGALRRAFARSPFVTEIVQESRREVPKYNKDGSLAKKPHVQRQCEVCKSWVGSTKIAVDHVTPVVSVEEGFQDWNEFMARLWCDRSNLQRICSDCHDSKTQIERIGRLTLKYTKELDILEATYLNLSPKDVIKQLNKYISKKKSLGLTAIANRAAELKTKIINKKV